jgi:hypothetical protein
LAGTQLLTTQGDFAALMHEGMDPFLTQRLAVAIPSKQAADESVHLTQHIRLV